MATNGRGPRVIVLDTVLRAALREVQRDPKLLDWPVEKFVAALNHAAARLIAEAPES